MSTHISTDPALGRVLIASAPFAVGEVVLCEKPLITWPYDDWSAYLVAVASDPSVHDAILDMFHPALDAASASARAVIATTRARADEHLGPSGAALSPTFAHTALLVAALNAHAFTPAAGGRHMALFARASKAAHSCAPCVAYTSRQFPGSLVYKATGSIAAGEGVAFAYIDDLFITPTEGRRAELERTKMFRCHCDRCDAPDVLRSFVCGCGALVAPVCDAEEEVEDETEDAGNWRCGKGCAVGDERVKEHFGVEEECNEALQSTAGPALGNVDEFEVPEAVEQAVVGCRERLSPLHTIYIQGLKLFATVLRVRAGDAKEAGHVEAGVMLWRRAAEAKMDAVAAMECVAAMCGGGCEEEGSSTSGGTRHSAVYHLVPEAFEAAKDLAQTLAVEGESSAELAPLARRVARYVPFMYIMWPNMKADVATSAMLDNILTHS